MRLVKPILIIAIVVGGVVLSPRIGDPRRWFNEPAGATAPAPAMQAMPVPVSAVERILAVPPERSMRPTIDSRTPLRSAGTAAGSKPAPRSRTNTCARPLPSSA